MKKQFKMILPAIMGVIIGAESLSAATIYSCSNDSKKCVVRLQVGKVGDRVRVLDESAKDVAIGRIIKRKGVYGEVALKKIKKKIKRGYPVLVDVNSHDSAHEWAASFSYSKD